MARKPYNVRLEKTNFNPQVCTEALNNAKQQAFIFEDCRKITIFANQILYII